MRVVSGEDGQCTKREPDVWDRAGEIMGTSKQLTWGVEDSAYAIGTLAGAGYRTLGIYDSDDAGAWEALQASAEHAVRSFEDLTVEEFLTWNEQPLFVGTANK